MTSAAPAPEPFSGVKEFSRHNPNTWWFILAAANVGALVLLGLLVAQPFGGSRLPGLITGLLLWAAADAVLIPVAVGKLRQPLVLDFDRGTITAGGLTLPAAEFASAVETTRSYPGRARMLTLVYAKRAVEVQVDGFAAGEGERARNDALLAFITRWLTMPDRHRARIGSGPMLVRDAIGRQEVAALLRIG